ncbi:MAG: thiolase family protein [Stellaceae bacterium]
MQETAIPYGAYWSTPFAKWQGSLSHLHSLLFAAYVARKALARRGIDPSVFDHGVLGTTVPQLGTFYGLPWLMGEIGAPHVAGPSVAQACATGVRSLAAAVAEVRSGMATTSLTLCADRVSNGPSLYYPDPRGTGGQGHTENWVLDNFGRDPFAKLAMVATAENVARKFTISTEEQNETTLLRYGQYEEALANDHAFQRRYMDLPFEVPDGRFRRTDAVLEGDEGIHKTTAEGLAKLCPVTEGGTVTFGGQTHPADGNAAIVVTTPERARDMSTQPGIAIRVLGFGSARATVGYMPEAPIPATRKALDAASLTMTDIDAINSHNPFVVNDIAFARTFNLPLKRMNRYGCSLVWGHPQAPTGLRGMIELIEELALRGGGRGLFQGCAAGDTAMAAVIEVADAA